MLMSYINRWSIIIPWYTYYRGNEQEPSQTRTLHSPKNFSCVTLQNSVTVNGKLKKSCKLPQTYLNMWVLILEIALKN